MVAYNSIKTVIYNFTNVYLKLVLKFLGVLTTFYLFAFGILLFRVDSLSHYVNFFRIQGGFDYTIDLYLKLLLYSFPIFVFDILRIYNKSEELYYKSKMNPIIIILLYILFSILYMLLASFDKKDFFYFRF